MAATVLKNQAFTSVDLDAWTSFVPSWTNLTPGSGTNEGAYCQIGKVVHFRVRFIFGSGSAVGTAPRLTLPVSISAAQAGYIGVCMVVDSGTASYGGYIYSNGDVMYDNGTNMGYPSATTPMTWTTNDFLTISGTYEAA